MHFYLEDAGYGSGSNSLGQAKGIGQAHTGGCGVIGEIQFKHADTLMETSGTQSCVFVERSVRHLGHKPLLLHSRKMANFDVKRCLTIA